MFFVEAIDVRFPSPPCAPGGCFESGGSSRPVRVSRVLSSSSPRPTPFLSSLWIPVRSQELQGFARLALKHNLFVISDEVRWDACCAKGATVCVCGRAALRSLREEQGSAVVGVPQSVRKKRSLI